MISYTENKKLTVINLFGGPGCGKTLLAFELTRHIRLLGRSVEYVSEYAKELTFEERHAMLTEQDFIFAEQNNRLRRLVGQVDFVVIDSPLLMGLVYCHSDFPQSFYPFVVDAYNSYNNINILLKRSFDYDPIGRNQTEQEAIEKDEAIIRLLNDHVVEYMEIIPDSTTCSKILTTLR